jgi:lipoprotein-releasing system ATP-binding protein
MSRTGEVVLRCRELCKTYVQGGAKVAVLAGVSLDIVAGETVALVGTSGSGKTTLLHLLAGLDDPSTGWVELGGTDPAGISQKARGDLRNRTLGFVYQFHHLLGEFTAEENVAMPLLIRRHPSADAFERARALLERVGLASRARHRPSELSGGERQRAAVARALITRPTCVLADEPTGNLDRRTAESIQQLLIELNEEFGTSLVVATHDAALAGKLARVVRLVDGALER